jgi:hypothetical protein
MIRDRQQEHRLAARNKLKEMRWVVQWQLPVYGLPAPVTATAQTKGVRIGPFGEPGAYYITPRNDAERQTIEALKAMS